MNKDETISFDAEENSQSKESVAGKELGIPTIEEFIKSKLNTSQSKYFTLEELKLVSIEFTKLHVKAALQEAADNAEWISVPPRMTNMDGIEIDENSILNAYPESNIK